MSPLETYAHRHKALRERLATVGLTAFLFTDPLDIRWLCGFTGSNSLLLVTASHTWFVTDGRYTAQAQTEVHEAEVVVPGPALLKHIAEADWLEGHETAGFAMGQCTVAQYEKLQALFPDVEWQGHAQFLADWRAVKSSTEIAHIRAAQAITDAVFNEILPLIRPGLTERELAAEIVYRHVQKGASRMSFDPIVASGPNSALPHARPTGRAFKNGDVILLDFGCFYEGYASDMSRTISLGPPSDQVRNVYQTVRAAQEAALEMAHAGIAADQLDGAARRVIENAGYGAYFAHGLGHGVGLDIHEAPRVSYTTDAPIPAQAVVTIEPGIYLPAAFGVRIEDLIVVQEGGIDNLTQSPKNLIVV